jgi:serine/threonine-protein kinase
VTDEDELKVRLEMTATRVREQKGEVTSPVARAFGLGSDVSDDFSVAIGDPISAIGTATDTLEIAPDPERYADEGTLGAGGMGEVRLVHDRRIGRHVAKKTMHPELVAGYARRFLREARVQGQLEHPAVVPVYDLEREASGVLWFTMKRIRGRTLAQILEALATGDADTKSRFGRRRLLSAFAQVCHAVHYAHARGVVHRDIKPGNVMLGDFGEVYVLDWGVAKVAAAGDDSLALDAELTSRGEVVGSPAYMPPEQLMGDVASIDARSDVFALGVILYEILTTRRFREGISYGELLMRVATGERPIPSEVAPDVPPELDAIVRRAAARMPADRYPSARMLAEAIERVLEGDRDVELRRAMAKQHVERAKAELATDSGRLTAMREAARAIALDPEGADAQALIVDLITRPKGPLPPEVQADVQKDVMETRRAAARMAQWGYLAWLCALPFAAFVGIPGWPILAAGVGLTALCAAFSAFATTREKLGSGWVYTLAAASAVIVVLTSGWLGPFVLPPLMASTTSLLFATYVQRHERFRVMGIFALAVLLPFVAEALGWVPPAYRFEPGAIVLLERAIGLEATPNLLALAYIATSFVIVPAYLVGRLRDALGDAERRLHLQAWHLRHLFPAMRG